MANADELLGRFELESGGGDDAGAAGRIVDFGNQLVVICVGDGVATGEDGLRVVLILTV